MFFDKKSPQPISRSGLRSTRSFSEPEKVVAYIKEIYDTNVHYLRHCFEEFSVKGITPSERCQAHYPYVEIVVKKPMAVNTIRSYGFASSVGTYRTTITRPDIFHYYYLEQFSLLQHHHPDLKIEVGVSDMPIPLHFALGENFHLEGGLTGEQIAALPHYFDLPDLTIMDDSIPNGTYDVPAHGARPLALFNAARVDLSIQRLKHYTLTSAEHFQNHVLFTNYQFYIDEFIRLGHELMTISDDPHLAQMRSEYVAFVEPGNYVTHNANIHGQAKMDGKRAQRLPQMPAYHLKRADGSGITMVNIGVGPSNAKTITDHVAVLRPHAWIMLGHCAGLRNSQKLGDYVLAHAYVRDDGVLDQDVPIWAPIPALAEIQVALERAVSHVTGLKELELKQIMRTGTVATVSDRNWELREQQIPIRKLSQCRAVALDMESATIAANGFRFRVPYGTLLCVSDKPLHGQLKLPGMADKFYRERVDQHLKIGITAMEKIRALGKERLHSRKLRSFSEAPFQ
jgi:AMP nucleosidase